MFQGFAWKNGRTYACQGNKLYAIYPNVGGYQCKSSLSRRDAVLINRLRIRHTWITHSYLFSGDDQPVCSACQSPLTVKHFLIECVNFAAIRSRYFSASSMKDVFESVNAQSVIDFIKVGLPKLTPNLPNNFLTYLLKPVWCSVALEVSVCCWHITCSIPMQRNIKHCWWRAL